jgi:hypothetical protein
MAQPYFTYFETCFAALRMARPDYKEQARYTARAVRQANLGVAFEPLLNELDTATDSFDENLTDRQEPTQADTSTYHTARTKWLAFVEDTYIDFVKPKLRKLDVFADFKPFGKSKLAGLKQAQLLTKSQGLIKLYAAQGEAMGYPTLAANAQKLLQAVADADETRDEKDAATATTILDLADDRQAIARAQRRIKAQLELTFDEPEKVYSFFDFSAARGNKPGKNTDSPTPGA